LKKQSNGFTKSDIGFPVQRINKDSIVFLLETGKLQKFNPLNLSDRLTAY
jgi:hypothetical protein